MSKKIILSKSETDWERPDTKKDEEIDLSDSPEITPEQFAKTVIRQELNVDKNKPKSKSCC